MEAQSLLRWTTKEQTWLPIVMNAQTWLLCVDEP
jgi:hypothetical protein